MVQRHFRVVRRGYDPDEVDRHLHLVAELFSNSGARRHIGELEATLREREARLEHHERLARDAEEQSRQPVDGARLEAEATIDGAKLKANAEAARIKEAARQVAAQAEERLHEAEGIVARARAEAGDAIRVARKQRDEILDEARLQAEAAAVLREARKTAEGLLEDVRTRAQGIRADAEARAKALTTDADKRRQQQLVFSEAFVCETTVGDVRERVSMIGEVITTLSLRSVCETQTARWAWPSRSLRPRDSRRLARKDTHRA